MDTLAHLLWTGIIFHNTDSIKYLLLALFFGIMPDLFSWTIYLFTFLFSKSRRKTFGKPNLKDIPDWMWFLYGLTHSVFVFSAVFLIVMILTKEFPFYLFAWLIHILMDIPTHSKKFLPTPFLWPFSKYRFPGFSWGQPWFMLLNYSAIIIIIIIIII